MDFPEIKSTLDLTEQSHYLRLKLGHQIILIVLSQIHTILPILELHKVPNNDPAIEGVFNYHGQPVQIYHLTTLINEPRLEYNLNTLILLSDLSEVLVGFLVCEQMDIIDIPEEKITRAHANQDAPYVVGLVENEEWSAWVLDLEKLLQCHQAKLEKSHA